MFTKETEYAKNSKINTLCINFDPGSQYVFRLYKQ